MLSLTQEEKIKFSSFLFQNPQQNSFAVQDLQESQKRQLQRILAQKIAFQAVNQPDQPPQHDQVTPVKASRYAILQTICCCYYPQSQRDKFDITNVDFIKRVCGTFLLCKKDWLTIGNGPAQLYGYLWLNVTYIVALTVAGNLNAYFVQPHQYQFNTQMFVKAIAIVNLFSTFLPFIYMGILGCLGGNISALQAHSLYGYSLIYVIIPTSLCFIPSLFWHLGMLIAGGLLKSIFMYRNLTAKIDARGFTLFIVNLIFEALQFLITIQTFFSATAGASLSEGTKKVFGHHDFFTDNGFEDFGFKHLRHFQI